jgi:hypothetical protein
MNRCGERVQNARVGLVVGRQAQQAHHRQDDVGVIGPGLVVDPAALHARAGHAEPGLPEWARNRVRTRRQRTAASRSIVGA